MCTVTWHCEQEGYTVLFNRDEQKTRAHATPPERGEADGVDYLAPKDGKRGGTWLLANSAGVTIGILNHYTAEMVHPPASREKSRGLLTLSLAGCRSAGETEKRLKSCDLSTFRPFHLFAIASGDRRPRLFTWDGNNLVCGQDAVMPLTTSAFDAGKVIESRRRTYRHLTAGNPVPEAALLERYQWSHDPAAGAHSVCMFRDDARTVSYSRVEVGRSRIFFSYYPAAEDPFAFGAPSEMEMGTVTPFS